MSLRQKILDKLVNLYPPFLGAGIKLVHQSSDFMSCRVEMKLTPMNRNYVGTHFGGSLYAMTDPWYMLMLIKLLGKDYIVWDKAATIRFKKPGQSKVHADFVLTEEILNEIKDYLKIHPKMNKTLQVLVKDTEGNVVAEVDKVLYIKKKDSK